MLGEVSCYFETTPSLQDAQTPMLAAEFDTPLQSEVGALGLLDIAAACIPQKCCLAHCIHTDTRACLPARTYVRTCVHTHTHAHK